MQQGPAHDCGDSVPVGVMGDATVSPLALACGGVSQQLDSLPPHTRRVSNHSLVTQRSRSGRTLQAGALVSADPAVGCASQTKTQRVASLSVSESAPGLPTAKQEPMRSVTRAKKCDISVQESLINKAHGPAEGGRRPPR
jgi:hypothetical protein